MQSELEMAVAAVVTDWSGDRYVNGNNQSLTQYMTKARVESNMNTEDYVLAAFTLNTTNGVNVTYKNKGYNFTVTITDSGNSAKVTYEGEGEPAEVKEWIENEDGSVTDGEVTLQVGDYINYDPLEGVAEENTTYTSLATTTGYDTDQVFDIQNYVDGGWRWQVFGVEDGKLQIISENTIGTTEVDEEYANSNYYLVGRTGYQNAITELDKISELYGQGEYAESARSITVEDVNKITGYNPEENFSNGEGELDEYGNIIDYFWQGTNYPYYSSTRAGNGLRESLSASHKSRGFWWYDFEAEEWKSSPYQSGATTPAEPITESSLEGDNYITTLESNDYDYTGSDYISDTSSSLYKMLFDDVQYTEENSQYWFASRSVDAGSAFAIFNVLYVYGGSVYSIFLADSCGYEYDELVVSAHGVRPLVSLQSNIQLTSAGANTWDISAS